MILVSACLLGHKVKYSGDSNRHKLLCSYDQSGQFLAVCPECLGSLPVPRPPVEIQAGNGRKVLLGRAAVRDADGHDVTQSFLRGAQRVWQIAETYQVRFAVFKEGSPSCGAHHIYDGTFSGKKIRGMGVCAALLAEKGIKIYGEKELTPELLKRLLAEDHRLTS